MMQDYSKLVEALRCKRDDCEGCDISFFDKDEGWMCQYAAKDDDAADAIEALQAEVKRLQDKLCDWCAVCPKERRRPEDCELLSETPVMYGPSDAAKMEVQE